MAEPMSNADNPKRDSDEMSIASDFSIIPESFSEQEGASPGEQRSIMATALGSFQSDHFQPSTSAETSFGKVLFQNVQATYTADSDIAVSYVLTPSVTAKSSDRVALYRVGFGSPQDYLTYQWAPTPSKDHTTNQLPLTVVFKASALPKDAGEFFQFCYVTHEGQIVGVSTPFQLHPVGTSNVCGMDDGEDGMVVVCTKESVLHDNINKLTEANNKLKSELDESRDAFQQKQGELDDKVQQLNMCQHHLQALEAKMKKETSEKCELMGRVGQVVEEKGYLEDRVKTLERNYESTAARTEELEEKVRQLTEEKKKACEDLLHFRKVNEQQDIALSKCQQDLSEAEGKLKSVQAECVKVKAERDQAIQELELWTSTAAADKDEKNSLALKFSSVTEELIAKSKEIEHLNRLNDDMDLRLTSAVDEMIALKGCMSDSKRDIDKAVEERNVYEERLKVVNQDNEQLKLTIQQLKNKVESLENVQGNDESGREAAERIASDLSGRLQTAKAEYHALALTNLRLVKKIKKLRQSASPEVDKEKLTSMAVSLCSQGGSWINVDGVDQEKAEDLAEDDVTIAETASCMTQSCASALTTTTCSNCSHSTRILSEAVHRKMEDIVRELSLQIQSLKNELKAREREQDASLTQEVRGNSSDRELANKDGSTEMQAASSISQEVEQQQQQEQAGVEEEVGVQQAQVTESFGDAQREASAENTPDQQVLYSNSFLPAQRTAPVFFPERERHASPVGSASAPDQQDAGNGSVRPSAPSPTPSMLSQRGVAAGQSSGNSISSGGAPSASPAMIVSTALSGSNLIVPQAHLPLTRTQPISGSILPPPLLPETTPTARQAAVMSQFSSQQIISGLGHESDDDDFHSTSDNDDTANISNEVRNYFSLSSSSLFECPMCGLSFQPGAIRLLEEHINSHLEHVCPVCSMAFQRNNTKRFEEHVHAHFPEEVDDDNPLDDPSGPWEYRATRLLEID